ncbi:MAG: hypothetical protein IMZ40_01180, partial [Bacilli bacterium]|nr:hypothetical protein [Bacilli bacterium]
LLTIVPTDEKEMVSKVFVENQEQKESKDQKELEKQKPVEPKKKQKEIEKRFLNY